MPNRNKSLEAKQGSLSDALIKLSETQNLEGLDRVRSVLSCRMAQYNDLTLDDKSVRGIVKSFQDIEIGTSTSIIMICSKAKCLYRSRCPLFIANACPEGKECLLENKVLTDAMDRYINTLEIDLDNYVEMVMVNQLVEFEVLEHRCNNILSFKHTDLKMETVIGIDDQGLPITKEDISHAYQVKERIFSKKLALMQELTATRREKYKKQAALKQTAEGPARVLSDIKKKLQADKFNNVNKKEIESKLSPIEEED